MKGCSHSIQGFFSPDYLVTLYLVTHTRPTTHKSFMNGFFSPDNRQESILGLSNLALWSFYTSFYPPHATHNCFLKVTRLNLQLQPSAHTKYCCFSILALIAFTWPHRCKSVSKTAVMKTSWESKGTELETTALMFQKLQLSNYFFVA